jgi:hypothetical protein
MWCFNDQLYAYDEGRWLALTPPGLDERWHPMQPLELDEDGTVRFRKNKIVRLLLDTGKFTLNDLASMLQQDMIDQADYTHLMQLIGYSVDGYGELSTSPPELVEHAEQQAELLRKLSSK